MTPNLEKSEVIEELGGLRLQQCGVDNTTQQR